jgi:hypothetical protein
MEGPDIIRPAVTLAAVEGPDTIRPGLGQSHRQRAETRPNLNNRRRASDFDSLKGGSSDRLNLERVEQEVLAE